MPPQEREIAGAGKLRANFHVDNNLREAIFILPITASGAAMMLSAASPSSASPAAATAPPPVPPAASTGAADVFDLPFPVRAARAMRALGRLVRDPYDTQQVFILSSNLNVGAIRRRLPRFYASAEGQRLYAEDRSIDTRHVDLDALAQLPDGSLGREYARFLAERGFSPDLFQAPENVADPRASYVMKRLRQTHDLWHVVTGHPTTPAGEVALQAFTYGQVGAPSALLIALAGTVRGVSDRRTLPAEVAAAYRAGRRAAPLAAFAWEDHWATPLSELRALLDITPVAAG
jgi:ubiquinone biosynthesis protein COQ4